MVIRYSKDALKFLNRLDKKSVARIRLAVEGLTHKPPLGDIKEMRGSKAGRLRLRVGADGASYFSMEQKEKLRSSLSWKLETVETSTNKEERTCLIW